MELKEKYIDFCRKEENLPIFFQPWYLDGVCPNGGWDAVVAERDDNVVAIFPYYKKYKKPYNYITMPPNSRMMGPYVSIDYREVGTYRKIIKELSRALPKVEFFYQSFHYAVSDWLTFYSQKYNGKKLYSFILSGLSDLDKTYSRFNRDTRNDVIPVAGLELRIESDLNPEIFFDLLSANREEQNKKLQFDYMTFKIYYDSLIKNKAAKIYYAVDKDQKIHSTGLLMWDKLSSYFFLSAEDIAFRYSKSLAYLTWHCIKVTSKKTGLDFFDFGGNHVGSSENDNHPFGATKVPFLNLSRYDSKKFGPFKTIKKRLKKK